MSSWDQHIRGFLSYLLYEKGLSPHSVAAYERDVRKLVEFLSLTEPTPAPEVVRPDDLRDFFTRLGELGIAPASRARILSGLRAFFKYLLLEDRISTNPAALLDTIKTGRSIPSVLRVDEIQAMLDAIDLSTDHGTRDRAMLETLYACGLRVSELIGLRLSHYFPEAELIRVIGKNNKERIIPIGRDAIKYIGLYLEGVRMHMTNIDPKHEDFLFLNRRGKKLSRVYVFTLVKDLARRAGIEKNVSPHTFRHSFATHLIEGGAHLKAVQDLLGHESIITTEIYTHLDLAYLRDTLLRFHPMHRTGAHSQSPDTDHIN